MSSVEKSIKRSVKREVKKTVKNNSIAFVIALVFFIVFLAAGFISAKIITRNDGFVLNDTNKDMTIEIGGDYEEKGAELIVFGRDVSNLVKTVQYDADGDVVDKIDTNAGANYDIVYSVDTESASDFFVKLFIPKYKDYKQVRHITVK